MDWIAQANKAIKTYMQGFNAVEGVSYQRTVGGTLADLKGTYLTFEQYSSIAQNVEAPIGVRIPVGVFVLPSDVLGFDPVIGDKLLIPINSGIITFDACEAPGDGKCWCYFDKHRYQISIYLQESDD